MRQKSLKKKYLIKREHYQQSWEDFLAKQKDLSEEEQLAGFKKHLYELDELAFLADRIAHPDDYVIIKVDTTDISYETEQRLINYLDRNKLSWKMRFVKKFD